jgi:molybdenum cofactor biosynthesis protein B
VTTSNTDNTDNTDNTESSAAHKTEAATQGPITIAIVTVSDTRTPETDKNGAYLKAEIAAAGHHLGGYTIVKDEPEQVLAALEALVADQATVILFNGGTGIAPRDTTYDALSGKLEKTLPGFGELFRMLSYEEISSAAMLSRATAGVYGKTVVFSMPGSSGAVRLAWQKLIAPELQHLAWLLGA